MPQPVYSLGKFRFIHKDADVKQFTDDFKKNVEAQLENSRVYIQDTYKFYETESGDIVGTFNYIYNVVSPLSIPRITLF